MAKRRWRMQTGEVPEALRKMRTASVHAVITDPPAGIGYQSREWDGDRRLQKIQMRDKLHKNFISLLPKNVPDADGLRIAAAADYVYGAFVPHPWTVWLTEIFAELVRVTKPGGWLVFWTFPRTKHRLAAAAEMCGLQIVDEISMLFGSGFPKSLNMAWAVDRALGHKRKATDLPISPEAEEFEGRGTALRPSREDWLVCMKPLEGNRGENAARHGTGSMGIDDARITASDGTRRYPGHTVISEEVGQQMPAKARRAFYCPLPGTRERDFGLEAYPDRFPVHTGGELTLRRDGLKGVKNPRAGAGRRGNRRNTHPTVKGIDWMRYLILLFSKKGQIVLDPFAGSGSTGCAAVIEGRRFIGVEMDAASARIARARIKKWEGVDVEPLRIQSFANGKTK